MSSPTSDWRDVFCGRSAELQALRSAYDAVAVTGNPQVVAVLGDRGMGKTRLVSEFYAFLTRERDPEHYWPGVGVFRGRNLLVGPDVERDPSVREHFASFNLGTRRMPFLWWGIRLGDPDDRNAVPTDLSTHHRFLNVHLEPIRQAGALAANKSELVEVGRDTVQSGAMKLVEAIPFAGPAIGLLVEGALTGRRVARLRAERQAILERHRTEQVARLARAQADDLIDATIEELALHFGTPHAKGTVNRVPLVLFVDDAQFARTGGDESVLRLLTDLWARAQAEGWPVLLIATHWEREWWNVESDNGNATFAAHFRSFVSAGQGGLALSLGREPALATLVQAGLGDLSDADVELLLDRADGNPQLLLEIVERARRSPAWRETGGGLSEAGRRQLATARFELHELIRQRMESDDTPDSVRRAMAVSSVQGVEFSCAVAERAGSLLHAEHVRQGLEVAERPHRYVQGVERGVAGFLQRAYRDAALSLVDGQFGSSDDVAAALLKATDELLEDHARWNVMDAAEQDAVLSLRVSLGESSPDESGRRKAAGAIVQCVRRALESTPSDMPRAATWAQRFQAGVEDGRWDSSLLDTEDLSTVESTLRYWLGEGVALRMSQDLASRLREMSDAGEDVSSHLIIALWNVAAGLRSEGRAGEADTTSAEALSLARAQYAADPSRENRRLLQVSLERHGVVQAILADTEQAEQCYREMLDLVEWGIAHDGGAADPEDVATHVHALLALADSVLRGNEPDNARELLLKAYEVQQSRANLAESSTEDVRRLMGIRLSLAELVAAQGEFENAWEWVAPVLPAARELFESTPRADHRLALCAALERASDVAWAGGNMELAVALVSEAVERMEELSPPPDVAYAWRLARLYRELAEHRQMADVSAEVREGLSDEDYEGGIARTLRRSLNGARALLACDPAIGWMVAEIAGRLGGHLMLRNRLHKGSPYASAGLPGESSGGSIGGREGTGNDLEALRHELAAAIGARENGEETWGNWYQGGLFALEAMANAARDIGMAGTCVAAHELALELVLEYATEVPGDEAFEDLLHWIILSGHNLLLLNARPDPQLVLQCARAVLAGPRSEETDGTGTFRSAACSILATLGADIPADDRMLLHREATEWFERYPSPMATLAGYESEIECGVLDHDCATRCTMLNDFAGSLPEEAVLEWSFLGRLRERWGC